MILCTTFCLALAAVGLAGIAVLLVRCMLWRRRQGRLEASRAGLGNARRAAVGGVVLLAAAGLTAGLGWRALRPAPLLGVAERGRERPTGAERLPSPAEVSGAERAASQPSVPPAPVRFVGADQERFAARWDRVYRVAGPPPGDPGDFVPCDGYTTAGGVTYPPYWRRRPNGDRSDNLRAEKRP